MYSKTLHKRIQKEAERESLIKEIDSYLTSGGLFNPECAEHDNVSDLLIRIREHLKDV